MTSCAHTFPLTQETMHFFNAHVFPNDQDIDHDWVNPLRAETLEGSPSDRDRYSRDLILFETKETPLLRVWNSQAIRSSITAFTELTHSYLMFGRVSKRAEAACVRLADDLAQLMAMDQEPTT